MFEQARAHRADKFLLRPTAAQRDRLERMGHARRFAYNWGLERWRAYHAENGETISFKQLLRELTGLKREPELGWLRETDSQALQQALFDLRRAYTNFFERRARYPRFKARKRDQQRFRIPQRVKVKGDRIYIPKVGWVKALISRPVNGPTKSATFKRDATGKWFVSLVSEFGLTPSPQPIGGLKSAIGIDLGVRDLIVLSDGKRVAAPRFAKRAERRIKRAHRSLSRTRPGSRNRTKARLRLARTHQRTVNQRKDFLHKQTTRIVRNHDLIAIEDLGVTGLARTKLARAVLDCAPHELRRQLTYKAHWRGKQLVVVNRWFPSSKLCGACGAINKDLVPRTRTWTCRCGAIHDRDLNAARNLRDEALASVAAGRADTNNACGASVGPPTEAAGEEAGIP